jgi:hypothetical protein
VVVLTHDLVFVAYLLEHADELGLDLHAQVGELRGRREVEDGPEDLIEHLRALAEIEAWEEARAQLSTRRISQRIGELSKLAITGRLQQALAEEIEELDPIAERVELKPSAGKGKPLVRFKLRSEGRERVAKVLSTGEQTTPI